MEKITCILKSSSIQVKMAADTADKVHYFIEGYKKCLPYISIRECIKYNFSKAIAEEFLEKPEMFEEFCRREYFGDNGVIQGYEMFLLEVEKESLKFWNCCN